MRGRIALPSVFVFVVNPGNEMSGGWSIEVRLSSGGFPSAFGLASCGSVPQPCDDHFLSLNLGGQRQGPPEGLKQPHLIAVQPQPPSSYPLPRRHESIPR